MSIVVNTNVSSINAQRSLYKVDRSLTKAMERLASGMRINRSADDAAGLAIATGLQSQVRGLGQAVRNASDGLSVIGMADGAVNQQVEILQRIRELAVQAASDLNSASNRASIQQEIDNQIEELTRIGNTVEFNGTNLINGTFTNKKIQVGAQANQEITVSIGDFRAAGMGQIAQQVGFSYGTAGTVGNLSSMRLNSGPISGGAYTGAGSKGVQITSGTTTTDVGASQDDGVSAYFSDRSAISKANAINAVSGQTGVTASVGAATWLSTTAITAAAGGISTATKLEINGVVVIDGSVSAFATGLDDSTGSIRSHINAKSNETGVTATMVDVGGTMRLQLTAADGRNIILKMAGTAANTGVTVGDGTVAATNTHQATGILTLTSNDDFTVVSDSVAATNMLGLTSVVANSSITVATDPNKAVNLIDVTAAGGSALAIDIIDSAISQIGDAQAELGALTNRLENTIDNLQVSIENLMSSESRIRDADFAVETANLTRAQIIQQAGVAVLAQANLRPQAALSLLK